MMRRAGAPIRIATRKSQLAMHQALLVAAAFQAQGFEIEIVPFQTVGDRTLDRPLSAVGTKGAFTRELEDALHAGEVDCCVHSLKDLPTESPPGLEVGAVLRREDPRDALVIRSSLAATGLAELPLGASVGTSSPRRRAQLFAMRPDLRIVDLRGNVGTRIAKVESGVVAATILACAGLRRLGLADHITEVLGAPGWLPAPGQGAIAVQIRAGDSMLGALCDRINHRPTRTAVDAERSFLAAFEGGCQLPLGALAVVDDLDPHACVLHGVIEEPVTGRLLRDAVVFATDEGWSAGRRLAALIREKSAGVVAVGDRLTPSSDSLIETGR